MFNQKTDVANTTSNILALSIQKKQKKMMMVKGMMIGATILALSSQASWSSDSSEDPIGREGSATRRLNAASHPNLGDFEEKTDQDRYQFYMSLLPCNNKEIVEAILSTELAVQKNNTESERIKFRYNILAQFLSPSGIKSSLEIISYLYSFYNYFNKGSINSLESKSVSTDKVNNGSE